MNEKLMELMKNKKFMIIFSGFIALIGLILIIKRKSPETQEIDNNQENEEKRKLRESRKTIRDLERKNRELEKKANGKQITSTNGRGNPSKTDDDSDDSGKAGKTSGDDENDDSDDSDDPK